MLGGFPARLGLEAGVDGAGSTTATSLVSAACRCLLSSSSFTGRAAAEVRVAVGSTWPPSSVRVTELSAALPSPTATTTTADGSVSMTAATGSVVVVFVVVVRGPGFDSA